MSSLVLGVLYQPSGMLVGDLAALVVEDAGLDPRRSE